MRLICSAEPSGSWPTKLASSARNRKSAGAGASSAAAAAAEGEEPRGLFLAGAAVFKGRAPNQIRRHSNGGQFGSD